MKQEQNFSRLALELLKKEQNSNERALERLDEMEDVCLISGKSRLLPLIKNARIFLQRNY